MPSVLLGIKLCEMRMSQIMCQIIQLAGKAIFFNNIVEQFN